VTNTSVGQPCVATKNQYTQPPAYITTPPPSNIGNTPPPPSDNSQSECYLTTSVDCTTPDQTTPNFAPPKPTEKAPPQPTEQAPPQPQTQPTRPAPQPTGNQDCVCDNNSVQVINPAPQPTNNNGNNQCVCIPNTITAPPAPQNKLPPVVANFTTPGGNQICDCTNTTGGNNNNVAPPPTNNGGNQVCDCTTQTQQQTQPVNQVTVVQPTGGNNQQQVPCIQPNNGSGTFQNLTTKPGSIFNLNECYQQKPFTRGPTAVVGKTELPISDNVTFATDSCAVANQNAGC